QSIGERQTQQTCTTHTHTHTHTHANTHFRFIAASNCLFSLLHLLLSLVQFHTGKHSIKPKSISKSHVTKLSLLIGQKCVGAEKETPNRK
ncbi:hypothetical protein LDENG_00205600, partial [Lucifuga dentata]